MPLLACGFLVWAGSVRVRRVEYVTGLGNDVLAINAASPTGYDGGMRRLILPEHNDDSYQWIAQTQQMFAQRAWRVRHVDYDNAPFGRAVHAASPYRWWLGLSAWLDHEISGRPPGLAVERAALFADPLLHLLLLVVGTIFVAWRFGAWPAALLSLGLVTIFPLAGEFLPGLPDNCGLAQACALGSVLLLLAGIGARSPDKTPAGGGPAQTGLQHVNQRARLWFFAAGIVGGFGLWINVASQVPILGGIALGALLAAWFARGDATVNPPETAPWRAWALGGAATSLGAYLIEYFPGHLGSWQLRVNHPLYGLAWLGGGELLLLIVAWVRLGKRAWNIHSFGVAVLGAAALTAVPVVMWKTHDPGFLAADLSSSRLTRLPDGVVAANLWAWLVDDGITLTACTTALPVVLVLPAMWLILRRQTGMVSRGSLALALGPVLVALGLACRQLSWWNTLDGMLLVLLVAAMAAMRGAIKLRLARWAWFGFVAVVLAAGACQLLPPAGTGATNTLTEFETKGLIKRDLAHWLAKQVGSEGAVVLAPLIETASLYYYGGLRGLATDNWENQDGLVAAVRIASATTAEEALALIGRREVAYLVIPSWDSYLDEFARLGLGQLEGTFMDRLHRWDLPLWLRPVPYQLPSIGGFEGQSVIILEVVEEQDNAAALSRIAEYFIEMRQLELAGSAGQALRRYPADLGVLVARAHVDSARGDAEDLAQTFNSLVNRLAAKADRGLPWDRRVSLAVVLARGKRLDLARIQVERCLAEIDEAKMRSLNTGSLYRLQVLGKAYGLGIADQRLHQLALDLLPDDLRNRLAQ